jgi:hypothetical protein
MACSGCGKFKNKYDHERRKHGNLKCHTCIRKRNEEKPTMRVAAKAARKLIKKIKY